MPNIPAMPANIFGGENNTGDVEVTTANHFPSFDTDMKMILVSLLRVTSEANNKLCSALKEGGLCEWNAFLDALIEPDFARELTYTEGGLPTHIPRSSKGS
eukprot:jgi/Psemu1/32468/gm1.32468_g